MDVCTGNLGLNGDRLSSCLKRMEVLNIRVLGGTFIKTFTEVSGLDQLGMQHGNVLLSTPGSLTQVCSLFAKHVHWLSDATHATNGGFQFQDEAMRESLYGTSSAEVLGTFPPKPSIFYSDFPFAPAVVNPATSLQALQAAFAATRLNLVDTTADLWRWISTESAAISADLHHIAADIAGTNEGEAIEASAATIREAAQQAQNFSVNAEAMGMTVQNLHTIHSYGHSLVNEAAARTAHITDPALKAQAEDAFVKTFTTTLFPPTLHMGVPVLRNLMATPPQGGYAHLIPTGMDHAVDAAGANVPKTLRTLDAITHNSTSNHPGSMARAHAALNELSSIAAPSTETAGTTTTPGTSAAAPQLSQNLLHPSSPQTSPIAGTVGGARSPQTFTNALTTPTTLGSPSPASAGRHTATSPVQPLGAVPHATGSARGVTSTTSRHAGFSAPGAPLRSSSGAGPAPLARSAQPLIPPAATSTPNHSPNTTASPRGAATPPPAVLGQNTSNSKPSPGRGPMAAFGPAGGRNPKAQGKGPVISVLAPEEKDANKRALLGKQTPRVAGPIGTWARQTPDKRQESKKN